MKKFFIISDSFSAVVDTFVISDIGIDRTCNKDNTLSYYLLFDFTTEHRTFEYRTNAIINVSTETFVIEDLNQVVSLFPSLIKYFQEIILNFLENTNKEICILNLDEMINKFLQSNGYKLK